MPGRVHGLVSVVIPAFDAERWIGAAIESALAQTHPDVEVIVVDNGSTDGTVDVVGRMPGVRLVRCAIRGPSAARNAGLDAARGEFVQFLDADDLLAPDKVERQLAALRATGADIAWGPFTRFDDGRHANPFAEGRLVRPRLDASDLAASLIRSDGFVHLAAALFRRGPAVDGVRFDESCHVVEDVRYLIALALGGARFVQVDGPPGFALREHDGPARASRVDGASFWASCVENAELVRRDGAHGDSLTAARVNAIVGVLLGATEAFHAARDPRLAAVLERLAQLDPRFSRRLRLPHRAVAPLLGYVNTLSLARAARRARDLVLGRAR
ncbi:MAG: glycosyltransferase family 2 protein [Gemmatimonadaceae bacterium]